MKKFFSILLVFLTFVSVFSIGVVFFKRDNSGNGSSDTELSTDYSTMTYVALGDSITAGTYLDNPYPTLVGNTLGFRRVLNYGINGTTTSVCMEGCSKYGTDTHNPMCIRYTDMIDNADIVSVMCGTNDWIFGHPFGTIDSEEDTYFYGALKILCSGLKEKYPNAFIFFMTPYNASLDGWLTGKNTKTVGVVVKEVCALYDIPVLDLYAKNDFNPDTDTINDGLHPNQEFMTTHTAPQIAQFIKDNYKK